MLQSAPGWRGPNAIRSLEAPRVHHPSRWRGSLAAGGARAVGGRPSDRVFKRRVTGVRRLPADRPPARSEPNRLRALLVEADPLFITRIERVVALAARHGIPTMYSFREYVVAGGLISYGTSL